MFLNQLPEGGTQKNHKRGMRYETGQINDNGSIVF